VYGVSLPQTYNFRTLGRGGKTVVGATALQFDLVIKVIRNEEDFRREANTSIAYRNAFNAAYPALLHYLVSVHSLSSTCTAGSDEDIASALEGMSIPESCDGDAIPSTAPTDITDEEIESCALLDGAGVARQVSLASRYRSATLASSRNESEALRTAAIATSPCRWLDMASQQYGGSSGGTLMMRAGTRHPLSAGSCAQWLQGVYRSLEAIHAAGYYHCDIRPDNVLLFNSDDYQLIDTDCAVPMTVPRFEFTAGGQYDMRGAPLYHMQVGSEVEWSIALEYNMVMSTLLRAVGWSALPVKSSI
jgi:serine/threonine protein kinase